MKFLLLSIYCNLCCYNFILMAGCFLGLLRFCLEVRLCYIAQAGVELAAHSELALDCQSPRGTILGPKYFHEGLPLAQMAILSELEKSTCHGQMNFKEGLPKMTILTF